MKQFLYIILTFVYSTTSLLAQDDKNTLMGKVSFVTSNNVYVKFESTEKINIGEFLQLNNQNCLQVTEKSSTSVVCSIVNNCEVKVEDSVLYKITVEEAPVIVPEDTITDSISTQVIQPKDPYPEKQSIYNENIRGRVSVASYNNFSNLREDRHRLQGKFSLNANHINDGKFSIETYLAYRNNVSVPENYRGRTSIFNVYNLNARYDATPTLSVTLGRKINPKASTFGANDGLQIEKYFGNFYVGAVGGFRPDFFDYGFNSDLLQYGGYLGIEGNTEDYYGTTTVGAMEQTNAGNTDRRYIFFQHASTIAKVFNLFGSAEMDIFSNSGSETRLTNLYLSARYRFSRAANLMVSYDSRKQIIYYETFQTEIEQILDDDLARQGIRIRLNVRPAKIIWMGASYSTRFQTGEQNKSDNIYGYITLTKIPAVGGRLNASYNMNTSRYLKSSIFSVRHSRDLVKNKLNADFYYRMADYDYENQLTQYKQNYYGMALMYRISTSWHFNISGEMSQFDDENSYRFYTQLTKRFDSRKKK
ncbi:MULTISPECIES: hypothetical protein [Aequorivita]|uniref:Outer membrane protein beta-barrel domain-containing protein n=1 Tax=Aequorivita iocasae TaxID=2803865 RepID=A0ABX7DVC9_9FLAO|nr:MULTISPECIES: hypothetical protein [Aequorivita]QQX78095.1 hypothetical protein JK629_07510 [Aequorivita iocasae]UCA57604.1 hypothetical protein LDL78_07555 [Aequorivita sp. F7]